MTQAEALSKARTLWGDTAFVQRCVKRNTSADRWSRLRWPTTKFVVVGAKGEVYGEGDTWAVAFRVAEKQSQKS